jgi:hypothetical protein
MISTVQITFDNHLGKHSKRQYAAGREIKNNVNIHFLRATGSGLSCLQSVH